VQAAEILTEIIARKNNIMKKTRRTEITIEKHEITVIHKRSRHDLWCETCGVDTTTFRIDEVKALLKIDDLELGGLVLAGAIHFIQASAGDDPLVCGRSLGNKNKK
jgi:hypothetical protein